MLTSSRCAGKPCVAIAIDHRIKEMCEIMLLPHITWYHWQHRTNQKYNTLSSIMAELTFDGKIFDTNRGRILSVYANILHGIGVEMNPALIEILPKAPH
jgi:hypothetical protein